MKSNVFVRSAVIYWSRETEFKNLPINSLIDFVGSIEVGVQSHAEILQNWQRHFEGLDVPYAITQIDGEKRLWKERRI